MQETQNETTDDPQALFSQAVAHFEAGDPAAARDVLLRIDELVPGHPQILNYLGTTTYRIGDTAAARTYFERALALQPDFDEALRNLGLLTFQTGDLAASAGYFSTLCDVRPQDAEVHASLGDVMQAQDRCADAIAVYEKALALDQQRTDTWSKLGRALLFEGRWDAALDATGRALALRPGHSGALALRSVALAELGREDELAALVDFDRLIRTCVIEAPPAYTDMAAFNRALSDHCLDHPTLTFNPADNTTRMGSQTGDLAKDADPGPIADLIAAIGGYVEAYRTERPPVSGHPFLGQRPDAWTTVIWGTVLGSQGHQSSHIHRDGWLSGVYYARVPDVLRDSDDGQAGWIEFGQPQPYPKATAKPPTRRFRPSEGTLYLFPSYFYHRTIPYEADVQRISIAFDLMPASR